MFFCRYLVLLLPLGVITAANSGQADEGKVSDSRLVAEYRFEAGEGWLADASNSRLHLRSKGAVKHDSGGGLNLSGGALMSAEAAAKPMASIKRAGAVAIELWMKTKQLGQKGPARIFTLSRNTSERNITVGQEGDRLQVRVRTTSADKNGLPPLTTSRIVKPNKWMHVIYTRAATGDEAIYVDGKQAARGRRSGTFDNWDDRAQLSIGDEVGGGRAWKGQVRIARMLARNIATTEALARFRAGADAAHLVQPTAERLSLFERSVAPLLADKCLECHDSATRQGGLDLSKSVLAMQGGDSGKVIEIGDAANSLLWQAIDSGEMPADRPALSDEEKKVLAKWIDDGAEWTFDNIDPAIYVHGGGDSQRWLARLTVPEYIATVREAVGVDIAAEARQLLPKDLRADGFSNTTYNLGVDLSHVEAYAELASEIVSRMDVKAFANRFAKTRRFTDKDMGALIEKMGMWLLRGPLDDREVIIYRGISTTVASAGGTYEEATGLIAEAMLQSPRFIYRVEDQRGDGGQWPVSQFELASRLSYMMWGCSPDARLLEAAKQGKLFPGEGLDAEVDRMLADKKTEARGRQFVSEWLNLNSLSNLQPDKTKYPNWDAELAGDMRRETIAYFQHVALERSEPLSRLLNYPVTFATARLAEHYNLGTSPVSNDDPEKSTTLRKYDLSKSVRSGVLTQGSVLTIGGDNASMVTRGLFVLHDLLRGVVKDPPPCVNTTPIPTRPGLTQRNIAIGRIESDACGGCHCRFEPLAFGLERFDGLGSYYEEDQHGNALRDDGEILVPGESEAIKYDTARQLMDSLASQERVKESLTWKVVQFAIGRPPGARDARVIADIHLQAQEAGGSYRDTMRAIALSDLARMHKTELSE